MDFLQSLVIGFSVASVPGPIFFEMVRRTIARGFWAGVALATGEFAGNLLLSALIFFGVSTFLASSAARMVLFLAGGAIMICLGVSAWKVSEKKLAEKGAAKTRGNADAFATGFGMAVTSPIVIAVWISLSGSYLAQAASKEAAIVNLFAISFGLVLFYTPLAAILSRTRHKLDAGRVMLVSKLSGIILVIYGASFLFQAAKLAL